MGNRLFLKADHLWETQPRQQLHVEDFLDRGLKLQHGDGLVRFLEISVSLRGAGWVMSSHFAVFVALMRLFLGSEIRE
jgi:hypothetical protein